MESQGGSQQINQREEVTTLKDALIGLTALNQDTVLLDYGPVIIRRNYPELTTVHLLSGGIAGKDLSYANFVGKGMLTAAVLGDEVAPNSRLIVRTIKELYEGQKCAIFVITRVSSEMFNFNLAVQRTSSDCQMRVKLLTVCDNKITNNPTCGFILLMKILGAMAEDGVFYQDMWNLYKDIADNILSVPLHFKRIEQKRKRGRPSVSLADDFESLVHHVIDRKSQSSLNLHPAIPIVALINVPRSLEKSAEMGLVKQVIDRLRHLGVCIARIYSGNFISMSSDAASLTVLKLISRKIITYVDAPCEALGWHRARHFQPEVAIRNEMPGLLTAQGKQSVSSKGPRLTENQCNIFLKSISFACEALISCERQLNIIDAEKSDGNVGTRFKRFSECLNKRLAEKKMPIDCPFAFFKKLSVIVEMSMGGTLGSIYGVVFEKVANMFGDLFETEPVTDETWMKALAAAEEAVGMCAGDERGTKTMYYPIMMCQKAILENATFDVLERFGVGVAQAEEAAQKTRMSTHIYADAGAHAVGIWMRAVYEGVKLMCPGEIVTGYE